MTNITKILIAFAAGIIGGFLTLHLFSFKYIEKYLFANNGSDLIPIEIVEKKEITIKDNEAIVQKAGEVKRSVVAIRTYHAGKEIEGSGLIISSDGLVVTLSSIVPLGGNFNFFVNGEKMPYEVIERDAETGLVLVKLEARGLATVEFGNIDRLKMGERVFLIGSFFNSDDEVVKLVNEGIVKAIDNHIITSIIEKQGFSSALFDLEGRVLGINLIDKDSQIKAIDINKIRGFSGL